MGINHAYNENRAQRSLEQKEQILNVKKNVQLENRKKGEMHVKNHWVEIFLVGPS